MSRWVEEMVGTGFFFFCKELQETANVSELESARNFQFLFCTFLYN